MSTAQMNPSDNSETDRLQAAAIMFTARRRAQEAAELSAEGQPTSRRSNPLAAAMVAEILGRKTEATPEEAKDAEASCDTPSLEAEELLTPSTEAQSPSTVQDEVPPPEHELSEPNLPESEPSNDEVDNDPRDAVQLPKQAREFGLLTRADVQADPSAIPLIHGLISKGQLVMIAGPSGSGKSVFQLHLGAALLNAPEVFGYAIPKRGRFLYVNLEGDLKHRLEAIELHYPGWSFPAPEAIFLTRPWRLNDCDSVEGLAHHVQQAGGVDVIFIDTLNRAIPGSDENLSTDMGMVIKNSNPPAALQVVYLHQRDAGMIARYRAWAEWLSDLLAKRQQLMQDWADYALGRRAGNMTVGHNPDPLASTRDNTADQHNNTEGAMQ